jgi:hypothetical protein
MEIYSTAVKEVAVIGSTSSCYSEYCGSAVIHSLHWASFRGKEYYDGGRNGFANLTCGEMIMMRIINAESDHFH